MTWHSDRRDVACEVCQNAFLIPAGQGEPLCPFCYQDELDTVSDIDLGDFNLAEPPEQVIPFTIAPQQALKHIAAFIMPIPIKPADLTSETLSQRLQRLYVPVWLTDASIQAQWKAEVGYHYQVVSHQERYKGGTWQSEEKEETRTRWEPRAGLLERTYDNVMSAAIEGYEKIVSRLGRWDASAGQPFDAASIGEAFVQVPTRSPEDSWREAKKMFAKAAAEEVTHAAEGDRIRDFSWQPTFDQRTWSQLWVPLYTTFYTNDDGQRRVLIVHGQTGATYGHLEASLKAARLRIIIALVAAGVLALGSMLLFAMAVLFFPLLGVLAVLGLLIAVAFVIAAGLPVVTVSQYNKGEHTRVTWLNAALAKAAQKA